jgi:hypothetical protein
LKKEMTTLTAAAHHNKADRDTSRWIPAKVENIQKKMESIAEWFSSGHGSINASDYEKPLMKKRYVMVTVCLNDEILQMS